MGPSTSSVDSSNLNLSDLNREVSAIPIVKSSILVGSSKADTSEAGTMVMETSFSPGAKPSSAKLKSHKTTLTRQLDILLEHKHRTLFERAVTDKQAANYSRIVKNPMSISKIKSRIRSGEVSTFADMKRDVLVMFTNSLMFNSRVSAVHQETLEMASDIRKRLEEMEANFSKIQSASEKTTF